MKKDGDLDGFGKIRFRGKQFDAAAEADAQPAAPRELPVPSEGPLELAPASWNMFR